MAVFNSGVRGKRAKDGVGVVGSQSQFVQKENPVPSITTYSVTGVDDTALDPAGGQTVIVTGNGFAAGMTGILGGTSISVLTVVSPTQVTFTSPAKSAGSYALTLANTNGTAAILVPGLIYSSVPTWTTNAGPVASVFETTNINSTLVATSDSAITYTQLSGDLPPGATLASDGTITGTAPVSSGATTYEFTVKATDSELQDVSRTFTITVNTDVVTWSTPASGQSYTLVGGTPMSTVTLGATSAAGYNVSYTANALPTGVTLDSGTISGTPSVAEEVTTLLTATSATTNRTATRTISWSVSLGDTYWKNVSLLLSGSTSVTPFINDASLNNMQLTIVGDTKPNNFNPYEEGYYSNYFDGSGDYLQAPANASALDLGAGDFTIEFWLYVPGSWTSGGGAIMGKKLSDSTAGWQVYRDGGNPSKMNFRLGSQSNFFSGSTPASNIWEHWACVRIGTSIKIYKNGILDASTADGVNISDPTASFKIGFADTWSVYGNYYFSNVRIVKGLGVYTGNFTTPTGPLSSTQPTNPFGGSNTAAITNQTSLLTCQSNRFIDNSTNNFAITKNGDVSVTPAHPFTTPTTETYNTRYSTYFDGTGDFLTIPNNAAFAFGTGDYTFECWVYFTSLGSYNGIMDSTGSRGNIRLTVFANGTIEAGADGTSNWLVGASGRITTNTWYHIALTRVSGVATVWVDGQSYASGTRSSSISAEIIYIGKTADGYHIAGQISNLRYVKGTALYTSTFTPSTTPLTAIANTSLLTCQDATIKDNSTNNFAITSAGQAKPVSISPFTMTTSSTTVTSLGSAYFDGTGDYLSAPNNSAFKLEADFTIQTWIYLPGSHAAWAGIVACGDAGTFTNGWQILFYDTGNTIFFEYNGGAQLLSTSSVLTGAWTHVAVTRSGSAMKLFLNGVQEASGISTASLSSTNMFYAGVTRDEIVKFTGYISDLQIIKGTALYTTNFLPPQAPLTPVANTQLLTLQYNGGASNNGFVDQSSFNNIVTRNGNPTQGTFSPFSQNGWSVYFDAASTYYFPANTALNIGAGAFTIEGWVNIPTGTSNKQIVCGPILIGTGGYSGSTVGALRYYDGITAVSDASYLIATGAWTHFAVVRENTSTNGFKMYVNGILAYVGTSNANPANGDVYIGAVNTSTDLLTGYVSNIRWVKGTAVYTTASTTIGTQVFTPSTTPLTGIPNTSLLTAQSNRLQDSSIYNHTPTISNTPKVQAYSPFGGVTTVPSSYSVYFDGTGDNITVGSTAISLPTTTTPFTMEAWVYVTAFTGISIMATNFSSGGIPFHLGLNNGTQTTSVPGGYLHMSYYTGSAWTYAAQSTSANSTALSLNTWYHVAGVYSGTTAKLFVNGVNTVSNNVSTWQTTASSAGGINIGRKWDTSTAAYFSGYISNARLVIGTAVYTTDFTPSTTPLTAIANTTFLTCQSSTMIDNSTNKYAITATGDAQPRPFNPFGTTTTNLVTYSPSVNGGSMYFDGNGDYLTVGTFAPDTNNFTVECWFYPTAWPSSQGILYATPWGGNNFQLMVNSGGTIQWQSYSQSMTAVSLNGLNQWYHVSVVKNGSSAYLYINGVLKNTSTLTNSILGTAYVGSRAADALYFIGYISDLRVTIGSVLYTSNFYPGITPATPTQTIGATTYSSNLLLNGTSGGIIDYHSSNNLETVGNTQLASEDPYAGTYYSNYFDGSGDYLTTAGNTALDMGTVDFTIECFVNTNGYAGSQYGRGIFALYPSGNYNNRVIVRHTTADNRLNLYGASGGNPFLGSSGTDGTTALIVGTWTHIALVRDSGVFRLYINGTQDIVISNQTAISLASSNCFDIGRTQEGSTPDWNGYISNFRVIKGTCLYPSGTAFTKPASVLTAISGTSLLTCQSNKFIDNSTNNITITKNGDTKVKSFNPFQQNTGKSLYFDGNGDYIKSDIASRYQYAFGSGDFTIEMCVYFNDVTTLAILYDHRNGGNGSYPTLYVNSGLLYYYANSTDLITKSVAIGQWYHVAVTRSSGTTRLFVNGTTAGTSAVNGVSDALVYLNEVNRPVIASSGMSIGTAFFSGYIKDLRVTKGVARYTSTFTPPATPMVSK